MIWKTKLAYSTSRDALEFPTMMKLNEKFWNQNTTTLQQGILAKGKALKSSHGIFTGQIWKKQLTNTYELMTPVKRISHKDTQSTDSRNLLWFPTPHGNRSRWILSWHSQSKKEKPKSWLWSTVLRKWHISSLCLKQL